MTNHASDWWLWKWIEHRAGCYWKHQSTMNGVCVACSKCSLTFSTTALAAAVTMLFLVIDISSSMPFYARAYGNKEQNLVIFAMGF